MYRLVAAALIVICVSVSAQTKPNWCSTYSAVQKAKGYSLCGSRNGNPTSDILYQRGSWCEKSNFFASVPISFKDPELKNNCTDISSHCVSNPTTPILSSPTCTSYTTSDGDVSFNSVNKTITPVLNAAKTQLCSVTQFSEPIQIVDSLDKDRQLLFVASQNGYYVVDMATEKVVTEKSTTTPSFGFLQQVTDSTGKITYIFSAQGSSAYVWILSYDDTNELSISTKTFALTEGSVILGVAAFTDLNSNYKSTAFGAVLFGTQTSAAGINFYNLQDKTSIITWNLDPNLNTVNAINSVQWGEFDYSNANAASPQCTPLKSKAQNSRTRNMIILNTPTSVYIYLFVQSDLPEVIKASDYTLYYTADNNVQVSSVTAFGECFGDFSKPAQTLWLAVSLYNSQTNEASLKYVPLPEFSETSVKCQDSKEDSWIKPTAYYFTGCKSKSTCSGNKYPQGSSSDCTTRVSPDSIKLPAVALRSTSRLMTRQTSNTYASTDEITYTYIRQVYVACKKHVSVLSFQEKTCEDSQAETPIVDTYSQVALNSLVKELSVSLNGQHLFVTVYKSLWELEANKRFVDICNSDLTNSNLQKFASNCSFYNPTPTDSSSYITYLSQCNPSWSCPRYGYTATADKIAAVEFGSIASGSHTIRPTLSFTCEPGFYCPQNSKRKICPVGFKCPDVGMTSPAKCTGGPKMDLTCATQTGLKTEQPCDKGYICVNAADPPIPAPGGTFLYTDDRTKLNQCTLGMYCPLGSSSNQTTP
ncbi:hypothetical protein AKO1_004564, partial [Acrasis kona]